MQTSEPVPFHRSAPAVMSRLDIIEVLEKPDEG